MTPDASSPAQSGEASFESRFKDANAQRDAGELVLARQGYEELLELRPKSANLLCALGDVLIRLGKPTQARARLETALELQPENHWAMFFLARICEAEGSRDDAIDLFTKGLARHEIAGYRTRLETLIDQSNVAARARTQSLADEMVKQGQIEPADRLFEELIEAGFHPASMRCKRAAIAIRMGKFDRAKALLDQVEATDPGNRWIAFNRAEILDYENCPEQAAQLLADLVSRHPYDTLFRDRLKRMQKRARRYRPGQVVDILTWPETEPDPGLDPDAPRTRVIAWDMTHNPVGRAAVLADVAALDGPVEIAGPLLAEHGDTLWGPLAAATRGYRIRGYRTGNFPAFIEGALRLAATPSASVNWASKARFPSLFIGLISKMLHRTPLVLDLDEDELAYVKSDRDLSPEEFIATQEPNDWTHPHTERWTRLAASMIPWADGHTACNEVMAGPVDARIVRHARNPSLFDPEACDLDALRTELGLKGTDRVVLYLGTPRRHKGLLYVAQAVAALNDPDAVFLVIGSFPDRGIERDLERVPDLRLKRLPDQPLDRAAAFNALADVVCVMQDPEAPASATQTPAKLSDAVAMGACVLVPDLPPISAFTKAGVVQTTTRATLVPALRNALDQETPDAARAARRAFFEAELKLAPNAKRAQTAFKRAQRDPAPIPVDFVKLLHHIDDHLPGDLSEDMRPLWAKLTGRENRRIPLNRPDQDLNVVFFWKQNDTGLYGRRQDRVTETLARLPRVRRILHIDAPISMDRLNVLSRLSADGQTTEGARIAAATTTRFLGAADHGNVHYRSFVYQGHGTSYLSRDLPIRESYARQVRRWMDELGMTENTLAWICPVAPGFDEVQSHIGFDFVVADFIDDQRQWPALASRRKMIEQGYSHAIETADVAFANCAPVHEWLVEEGLSPVLVPNGMDVLDQHGGNQQIPVELQQLPGPLLGYVGNMTARIDWDLLDGLTSARPDWSFVLIGAPPRAHAPDTRIGQIFARPNVHALGVVPRAELGAYLDTLDVAIVPHTNDPISRRMNPLKLYVFRGHGLPVVSTPVWNIDDFLGDIAIAASAGEMEKEIERALAETAASGRRFPDADVLAKLDWSARVATMLDAIDSAAAAKARQTDDPKPKEDTA